MRSHARVAIVGGGIIGCSILYHLTKLGWRDAILLERSELTSGSTWHAAAGFGILSDDTNLAKLNYYTIECYRGLEQETEQSCGLHTTGGLYIAEQDYRLDQLRIMESKAKFLGFDFERLTMTEARERFPMLNTDNIKGIWYQPDEGHLDPSGVTQAFARGARSAGAEVERFCPVIETNPLPDGTWQVVTENGTIVADHLVNAAGLWAREVAALAGITLPMVPMEHQYFVTEDIAEIAALGRELPGISDRDAGCYLRQEGKGLLVGAYEKSGKHWAVEGTPLSFGHELLPDDLERISDNVAREIERVPALGIAGIKKVINGPMMWSPDGMALLGPVPGLRNYFSATGIMTGIGQGGGLGKSVAEWIVHGRPEWDLNMLDIARFGDYLTPAHAVARSDELYATRYRVHYPYETLESARPFRTRPNYERQATQGAVFGESFGWENPIYYAQDDGERDPGWAYRRAKWFEPVGRECRCARESGALFETSPYAKYLVTGPDAKAWLDQLVTNRLPQRNGKIAISPLCNEAGQLVADLTICRLADDRFFLVGSGSAETYHHRWLSPRMDGHKVELTSMTNAWCGIGISGPKSRDLVGVLVATEMSANALPFFGALETTIDNAPCLVMRISFTGDLGYEIYFPEEHHAAIYAKASDLGRALGILPAGGFALNSLRLEKAYGSWFSEFTPDYDPYEAGLGRFVKLNKGPFIGRDALARKAEEAPRWTLTCFEIDASDADAFGSEPVTRDGKVVGEVTSGAFGFATGKSLALAYIDTAALAPAAPYEITVVGEARPARLLERPPYDPDGTRLRE